MAARKLTNKQVAFLKAFKKHATNASKACDAVGIDRQTYYNWKSANSAFKQGCEDTQESMIDFAESMLYKNIKDGKESSINFFLKTRGKSRGYVEKQEIEHSGNIITGVEVEFINSNDET